MEENKRHRMIAHITFIGSCGILAATYATEYMGFVPCDLCLYQRIPYGMALFIGIIFGIFQNRWRFFYGGMIGLSILSLLLAIHHVGVEWGWFDYACHINPTTIDTEDFLTKDFIHDCRTPQFKIMGFSMAELNVILSLCAIVFYYIYGRKVLKNGV